MRACAFRVVLAGFFAVAAAGAARADDILLNSDFSDGKTHWQGGGQAPSNMGGKLLVTLDPKKWTVLYQHFATRTSTLRLTIVYSLSSDCSLLQTNFDGDVALFTSNDLVDACGLHDDFSDLRVSAKTIGLAFSVCGGGMMSLDYIHAGDSDGNSYYPPAATARRTYSATLSRWWGNFDNDEFCLAFPPGQGTISLLKVTLTKIGD